MHHAEEFWVPLWRLKLWPFCTCQLEGGLGGGDVVSGRSSSLPNSQHPELMGFARNLGAQLKFMPHPGLRATGILVSHQGTCFPGSDDTSHQPSRL